MNKIIELLSEGMRTLYLLNVLNMLNLGQWDTLSLKRLIDIFQEYSEENFDSNKLLSVYNPLLAIGLTCEILNKISRIRKLLKNNANRAIRGLLGVANMFSNKVRDEVDYE